MYLYVVYLIVLIEVFYKLLLKSPAKSRAFKALFFINHFDKETVYKHILKYVR